MFLEGGRKLKNTWRPTWTATWAEDWSELTKWKFSLQISNTTDLSLIVESEQQYYNQWGNFFLVVLPRLWYCLWSCPRNDGVSASALSLSPLRQACQRYSHGKRVGLDYVTVLFLFLNSLVFSRSFFFFFLLLHFLDFSGYSKWRYSLICMIVSSSSSSSY